MPRLVKLSCGYCIKPETSECNKSILMPFQSAKFFHVLQRELLLGSVKKKNRYFRPSATSLGYQLMHKNVSNIGTNQGAIDCMSLSLHAKYCTSFFDSLYIYN